MVKIMMKIAWRWDYKTYLLPLPAGKLLREEEEVGGRSVKWGNI